MIVANNDRQQTTPSNDHNEIELLPEELRQVARRYAMLRVPQPGPEQTNRLIARLQVSTYRDLPPHQQRRVRPLLEVLAAVLMVSLLVGSFLVVLALYSHRSPVPSVSSTEQPVTLQELHMFDPSNGWATTSGSTQILHTSKGVLHWQMVSPERVAQSNSQGQLEATYFMDALRAWLVFSPHPASSGLLTQEPLFVERTTDGGRTWQERTIMRPSSAHAQQITFLTPQLGWLLLSEGAALGSEGVEVLHTTDGGATWQTMTRTSNTTPDRPGSLPFTGVKSGISFISPTTGWITGMAEGLYQTQDGGTTWYRQSLPLPDTLPAATQTYIAGTGPLFTFDGGEGILPVELGLSNGSVMPELYRTADDGQTWIAAGTLPAWPDAISFLNRQEGWAASVQQHRLLFSYAIFLGDYTWKTYSKVLLSSVTRIIELNFASNGTIGWMIGETNEGQSTLLLQTTDEGQTWQEIQPLLLTR